MVEKGLTEALENIRDTVRASLGHDFFEVDVLDADEEGGVWTVRVVIKPLYRDETMSKQFRIEGGDVTDVRDLERVEA
ncbi:MAG: hypothetical protein SVU88_01410 [Candidatus Nanohaloarchaea archaeon]|nr:hypothetical protein [Candidatus Nanohaloarchaea archaeon]